MLDTSCKQWQKFYTELHVSFDSVNLEPKKDFFTILVAKGLTFQQLIECKLTKKLFKFTGTTKVFQRCSIEDDRKSTQQYAIYLSQQRVLIYNDRNINFMEPTVLEMLLLQIFYCWQTGQYFEEKKLTQCAGSKLICCTWVPLVGYGPWTTDKEKCCV